MEILTTVDQQIGWLTLNRPDTRNAVNKAMWQALPAALSTLAQKGAQLVVIRGEGGAFASGADMFELQNISTEAQASEHWLAIRDALNAVAEFHLPTIAMIEGPCMGGGCLLAAACDIRIAEPAAKFCVPVAQLGIVLDADNIQRLVSLCGTAKTAELIFAAEVLSAEEAKIVGLINRVVSANELKGETLALARRVLANSHAAIVATKQTLVELRKLSHAQDQTAMIASYVSDEFRQRLANALGRFPKPE